MNFGRHTSLMIHLAAQRAADATAKVSANTHVDAAGCCTLFDAPHLPMEHRYDDGSVIVCNGRAYAPLGAQQSTQTDLSLAEALLTLGDGTDGSAQPSLTQSDVLPKKTFVIRANLTVDADTGRRYSEAFVRDLTQGARPRRNAVDAVRIYGHTLSTAFPRGAHAEGENQIRNPSIPSVAPGPRIVSVCSPMLVALETLDETSDASELPTNGRAGARRAENPPGPASGPTPVANDTPSAAPVPATAPPAPPVVAPIPAPAPLVTPPVSSAPAPGSTPGNGGGSGPGTP